MRASSVRLCTGLGPWPSGDAGDAVGEDIGEDIGEDREGDVGGDTGFDMRPIIACEIISGYANH